MSEQVDLRLTNALLFCTIAAVALVLAVTLKSGDHSIWAEVIAEMAFFIAWAAAAYLCFQELKPRVLGVIRGDTA